MSEFGPHAWKFLHYVSLTYPDNPTNQDKDNYRNFMISIKDILPCPICRTHYAEKLKSYPLTDNIMSDKNLFIKWVIDIHNMVNESKNKRVIPLKEALQLINTDTKCTNVEKFDNNNSLNNSLNGYLNNSLICILYIVLIGLVFIAISYKNRLKK